MDNNFKKGQLIYKLDSQGKKTLKGRIMEIDTHQSLVKFDLYEEPKFIDNDQLDEFRSDGTIYDL